MITGKSEELSNYGFKQRIPINHKISTVDTFWQRIYIWSLLFFSKEKNEWYPAWAVKKFQLYANDITQKCYIPLLIWNDGNK